MKVYQRTNKAFALLLCILLTEINCSFLHQQSTSATNNLHRSFPFAPILPASGRPFTSAQNTPGSGSLRGSAPRVSQIAGDWANTATEWEDRVSQQRRALKKAVIKAVRTKGEVSTGMQNLADQAQTVAAKAREVAAMVVNPETPGSKLCLGAVSVVAHFALEAGAELAEAAASGGWTEATLRSISIAIRMSAEQAEAAASLTKDLTGDHISAAQIQEAAAAWAKAATMWQTVETAVRSSLPGLGLSEQVPEVESNTSVQLLISLFAGCSFIYVALRLRRGTSDEALLLA
eukprot:gnl/MRDRNA2_/MRDRNA2_74874_c0_seq1.p1 gnl/MRDRNA2_/MRDRNA2_74874_c0~~gnl/MRDRNA2_/MRDRNA2_74874_c0_seq1.p1  ORF type:complete len:290 (+),score=58.76 gnl/MRDRNA2_/MRDRNA2_74874_c0_seq1:94-963(+)